MFLTSAPFIYSGEKQTQQNINCRIHRFIKKCFKSCRNFVSSLKDTPSTPIPPFFYLILPPHCHRSPFKPTFIYSFYIYISHSLRFHSNFIIILYSNLVFFCFSVILNSKFLYSFIYMFILKGFYLPLKSIK